MLALAAIASALLAGPLSRGLASAREREASGELLQTLRQARAQAQARQQPVTLRFDQRARCYQADGERRRCLPANLHWTLHTASLTVEQAPMIRFHPDGSSTGGHILLDSAAGRRRIDIAWLTGLASLEPAAP